MKYITLIFTVLSLTAFNFTWSQSINNPTKISGINLAESVADLYNLRTNKSTCDTIFSFNTRPNPSGLTWDGQNFWCADTSFIYKVNSSGLHIDSIINPAETTINIFTGGGLLYDGANLWLADEESAQLFKINPTNGIVLQQFNLPSINDSDPNGFGIAWDGNYLWHSQYSPPRLYKLNPTDGNIIDSLVTTAGILGIEWVNGDLYGISNQLIFKINTSNGAFQDSASWCVPFSIGLTWDGSNLWNVSGQDSIVGIPTGGKQKIYGINSDFTLSVHENLNNDVNLFPNPSNGIITLTLAHHTNGQIIITDILGKEVMSKSFTSNEVQVTLKSLESKGTYFAKVLDNDGNIIAIKKLIYQ